MMTRYNEIRNDIEGGVMDEFKGIDIKNIYTIVPKCENEKFDFINTCRPWDGFVLITSGEGYAIAPDGTRYEVSVGDIILLRKGDSYETHLISGSSYVTSGFEFEFDGRKDFPVELPFLMKLSQKQMEKIMSISEMWQSRSWESYTRCRIMLLDFYLGLLKRQIESADADKYVANAISYIHANFRNNFSGEDLAKHCTLSQSYLRSKFLKQTGMTITEYRDKLRISAARELLLSDYFTITEIANELGYCDIYHFSKAFKKHFGTSPTNYIKEKEEKNKK